MKANDFSVRRKSMKFKFLLPLWTILLGMALSTYWGCQRGTPTLAPPIAPQVIWSNGISGTWFSSSLSTTTAPGCSTTGAVTAVTDPISGDNSTLCLTTTTTCGYFNFLSATPADPTIYYPTGHLQFDLLLDQPPVTITAMAIEYLNSVSGNYAQYNFTPSFINALSTTSFTHVSIPFTSFTTGNGYTEGSVDTPLQISWSATGTGTAITIDNIVWTAH
jgi:hypothetical protein